MFRKITTTGIAAAALSLAGARMAKRFFTKDPLEY